MNKYIKKPVEVEALQIHGNVSEIKEFIGENGDAYIEDAAWKAGEGQPHTVVAIRTLEGVMRATDGDYIIKGVKGEFYPCRKDIFEETYECGKRANKWIPVTNPREELPKDCELYVTVNDDKYASEHRGYRNSNGSTFYVDRLYWDMTEWSDEWIVNYVIAYMVHNDPEPYQPESEDKYGKNEF